MALFRTSGGRIMGISAAVPSTMVSNHDYDYVTKAERDLLIKTTGIEKRYFAREGLTTGDLCEAAAKKLIAELNWDKNEIDLLIFVSQSPDHFVPATSIILQGKLGLGKQAAAFDINLGCSGYVYGLSAIMAMMATGGFRKALLCAGDISTAALNPKDKSAYPLFGDAGTVTAIEYDSTSSIAFNLQSDGKGKDAIIIPDGGLRNRISNETFIEKEYEPGVIRHRRNLWLNGFDVFNFSVREAPPNINTLLTYCGITIDQPDLFIMHQANKLMNETIRKKLKVPAEKVPYSLDEFGNTSSASIPMTIVARCGNEVKEKKNWLFASFGVGLSWASCYFESAPIHCPEVIFVD
ncbi:MAG TPA: ketoacyl-ACP synthase III [Bacteroidia bacterium]|jgi:3-oxoacyl-[acyl-carrier-protein] synthase-3|nr:ketoacyl-ACP synthase III [Bacteroidia bacterium]